MTNTKDITITQGNDQFYPTPDKLAGRMLSGIEWDYVETVLEPSAGKGDLAKAAMKAFHNNQVRYNRRTLDIDCIEIDPYLRQILQYNFSDSALKDMRERYRDLDHRAYSSRTEAENKEWSRLRDELDTYEKTNLHIIHDDFLTYDGYKRYNLILMNPPFANGDLHLLKALEVQKNGGSVVCLLNAETLLNPYTNTRKLLMRELGRLDADIQYIDDAFLDAERKTDVRIAIVRVNIPQAKFESGIYERMKKAQEEKIEAAQQQGLITAGDVEWRVQLYNTEVAAALQFIREYEAIKPYIQVQLDSDRADAILTLGIGHDKNYSQVVDVNKYLRLVRLKYWYALFHSEKIMGRFTSNIREKYLSMVEKMADYDFSAFNIQAIFTEMNAQLEGGVKETILALFDKLTAQHSWYPESSQNIHYFNGWKTNQAHKIGKKSIIPTSGIFSSYSWSDGAFNTSTAYQVISDIEKVFNYLDGNMTADVDLLSVLKTAKSEDRFRNIECKYFKVDLFKKGTTHIKFTNLDLVEKLNIYAARNKNWLPPNYGKTQYRDMEPEEQAVVDSFQGEATYEKVMRRQEYYLAEPTRSIALLTE